MLSAAAADPSLVARAALAAVLWWCCCCLPALAAAAPASEQCATATSGGGGAIIDLTVPVRAGLPVWEQKGGLSRHWRALSQSKAEGDVVNQSHLNLDAHTGTHIVRMCMRPCASVPLTPRCRDPNYARLHVPPSSPNYLGAHPPPTPHPHPHPHPHIQSAQDAPDHFLGDGAGIDSLPLSALVGPALVIDVAADANVTAALLATLDIPRDAARLLFRTLNTRRRLLRQSAFASDYVGLDSSAARWLAEERPGVRLVGSTTCR